MARGCARLRPRAARRGGRIPACLVTGASTGIGRATVERLLRRGWRVYASVRRAGDAPSGSDELIFDVTEPDAIAAAVAGVESLDGLVDNAGIAIASPLEFLPPEELTRQLDVNVVGQLRVLQAFMPALRRATGRVVIVGSVAGRSALPFLGAYAMSKFALEAMADSLRVELQPWGMHVAIIEPATIATPMWTKPQRPVEELPPEAAERYGQRLQQFGRLAAERSSGHAVSTDAVARAIEHALTAKKPRTRYLIGPDAKRRAAVQWLPDRARDRVLTRFLFRS